MHCGSRGGSFTCKGLLQPPQISVLLPDDESTRAFAHEKNTKAPEGTTVGVTTGGVIGGTLVDCWQGSAFLRFLASVHSSQLVLLWQLLRD